MYCKLGHYIGNTPTLLSLAISLTLTHMYMYTQMYTHTHRVPRYLPLACLIRTCSFVLGIWNTRSVYFAPCKVNAPDS